MKHSILNSAVVVFVAFCVVACDDKPTVPTAVLEQAKQNSTPKAPTVPTTQELLTGPRKHFELSPLPLTLDLPPGWGNLANMLPPDVKKSDIVQNVVHGYVPTGGEVEFRYSARSSMKPGELEQVMNYGKKDMAEKPTKILMFELRPLGTVKLLERQSVGEPHELTTYDANNQPHTTIETNFNWTKSVLVPHADGGYEVYDLSSVLLTKDQYDKNKDFLNSVLSTLRYTLDSSASPTSAPANHP